MSLAGQPQALAVNLDREVIPQHGTTVENVNRELL
jgi:hypothetical protein